MPLNERDRLYEYEREIMALWDSGLSLIAIAERTRRDVTNVRHVVTLFDDRLDPIGPARDRAACALLAARIRERFPHLFLDAAA